MRIRLKGGKQTVPCRDDIRDGRVPVFLKGLQLADYQVHRVALPRRIEALASIANDRVIEFGPVDVQKMLV